mgnify:FL=1
MPDPITTPGLAEDVSTLITTAQNREIELVNWIAGPAGGGPNSNGTYPLTDWIGNSRVVKSPDQLAADVASVEGLAQTSATASASSASASATSAATASSAASAALGARANSIIQRQAAESAASAAASSSATATASASTAQRWATEDEDVPVVTGEFSARHWALKAAATAASVAAIDDGATSLISTWSSTKIATELSDLLDAPNMATGTVDLASDFFYFYDIATGSVRRVLGQDLPWSVGVSAVIDDFVTVTDKAWSSDKIAKQDSRAVSANRYPNLVAAQIASDDLLLVYDASVPAIVNVQIGDLPFGTSNLAINDVGISSTSPWSSQKTELEITSRFTAAPYAVAALPTDGYLWFFTAAGQLRRALVSGLPYGTSNLAINDAATNTTDTWSSQQIIDARAAFVTAQQAFSGYTAITTLGATDELLVNVGGARRRIAISDLPYGTSNLVIDDTGVALDKVWSSAKTNSQAFTNAAQLIDIDIYPDASLPLAAANFLWISQGGVMSRVAIGDLPYGTSSLVINDAASQTTTVWSGSKVDSEITSQATVIANAASASVVAKANLTAQGSLTSPDALLIYDATDTLRYVNFGDLPFGTSNLVLNDAAAETTTAWSGSKVMTTVDSLLNARFEEASYQQIVGVDPLQDLIWVFVHSPSPGLRTLPVGSLPFAVAGDIPTLTDIINDGTTVTTTTWSSSKIDTELGAIRDFSAFTTGPGPAIGADRLLVSTGSGVLSLPVSALPFGTGNSDLVINDAATNLTEAWSGSKIAGDIQTRFTESTYTLSGTVTGTDRLFVWNASGLERIAVSSLPFNTLVINDSATNLSDAWSGSKITTEITNRFTEGTYTTITSVLDTYRVWVWDGTGLKLAAISDLPFTAGGGVTINDTAINLTETWSSSKIDSEIGVQIDAALDFTSYTVEPTVDGPDLLLMYDGSAGGLRAIQVASLPSSGGGGGLSASVAENITGIWNFNNGMILQNTTEFATQGGTPVIRQIRRSNGNIGFREVLTSGDNGQFEFQDGTGQIFYEVEVDRYFVNFRAEPLYKGADMLYTSYSGTITGAWDFTQTMTIQGLPPVVTDTTQLLRWRNETWQYRTSDAAEAVLLKRVFTTAGTWVYGEGLTADNKYRMVNNSNLSIFEVDPGPRQVSFSRSPTVGGESLLAAGDNATVTGNWSFNNAPTVGSDAVLAGTTFDQNMIFNNTGRQITHTVPLTGDVELVRCNTSSGIEFREIFNADTNNLTLRNGSGSQVLLIEFGPRVFNFSKTPKVLGGLVLRHANTGFTSSNLTVSSSAPSGGNDGDIWFQTS